MNIKDIDTKLREKVFDAFHDPKKQLGDVTYTEEERSTLKAFYLSLQTKVCWTVEDAELACAFLVIVTKNYKGEWTGNDYWGKIVTHIGWKPDYQYQLPMIGNALKLNGRPFFETPGQHLYVESLFYQAYSPKNSVYSFIKLAWSLYTNPEVFDYTFTGCEADENLCLAIIKSLSKHYAGTDLDSDFVFESTTYSIRAGLRYAFKQDQEGAAHILSRVLRYIDHIYNRREDVDVEEEGYLSALCNETVYNLIASYSERLTTKTTRRARNTVDDIDKIKASYVLQNGKLCLYFPKIRLLRDDQQFAVATVKVYQCFNNGRFEFSKQRYECLGEDYKHMLNEIYLPIDDYLSLFGDAFNIAVTLSFDYDDPVYDSGKTLFRNFIILKDEEEAKTSILSPDSYRVVFPTDFDYKRNIQTSETPTIVRDQIVAVSFSDGDRVSFNGGYVFFGQKEHGSHFFLEENKTVYVPGISFNGNSPEPYAVYKKLGNLIIRTDNQLRPDRLDLQVYTDSHELVGSEKVSESPSQNGIYSIDLGHYIDKASGSNNRLIIVTVKDISTDKYLYTNHLTVLPDIRIKTGDSPYLDGKETKSVLHFLDKNYELLNRNEMRSVQIETDLGQVDVEAPYFSWRINQGNQHWCSVSERTPFLKEEFQSNDYIYIDSSLECLGVFCGDVEIQKGKRRGEYKFGHLKSTQQGRKAFIDGEEVFATVLMDGEEIDFPLFSITNDPYLIDDNEQNFIQYENGKLFVNLAGNFRGNEHCSLMVRLEGEHSKIKPVQIIGGVNDPYVFENVTADVYTISVSYRDPHSTNDMWTKIWSSDDLEFGDMNAVRFDKNDRLLIEKISRVKYKNVYLSNIAYLGDDGFGPRFSCKIHSQWFNEYCEFTANESNLHSGNVSIYKLYYKEGGVAKEYSFDRANKCLSKQQIDGEQFYECLSIYSKKA